MPLSAGTRFGNFEILSPLGAGGMGEVYRARDVRLDRVVAIKSLPEGLTRDAERLSRFEREAKLLAALNHPNIASIYGVEEAGNGESGGGPCLVLEFVEGETLAQRIARGPLPVREVLEIGVQIAAGIDAAHERGIVHRDLKPGNIMITTSRMVKVLDFGLAKSADGPASPTSDFTASPTVAMAATSQGVILGTAPYMSPEQARGKSADRRTDVWAFGCILMECLTGRPTFAGETVSDVIAKILEREPDWSAIPAGAPPRLRDLVRRCLTKDVDERPRDMGDLRRELGAIAMEHSGAARAPSSPGADLPSLAVLYFENLAKDPDSDYFCSGVTEDILTDLSKIKGLKVASRNAVLRYRGAPADLNKVASELGVKAVLEGSVRRAGDRIRITAQLVNAQDGFQLWAERFDRKLDDVFGVQEEIASSIATALRVALTPAEAEQLVGERPKDVRAYDLYLKGRQRYGSYTNESLREALALFEQATVIDPKYALAWAGIADCRAQLLQWGFVTDIEETVRLGLAAARRAIELNPRLPEGHKAESLVLRVSGDLEGARASLLKAIEADPRHLPAIINLAVDSVSRANVAAAERFIRRALELDPQEPFATSWLIWLTMLTKRPDEMLGLVDRLRKLSDDPFYVTAVHIFRVMLHINRGDLSSARDAIGAGLADGSMANDLRVLEAVIAVREGRNQEAVQVLRELEREALGSASIMAGAGAAARAGDLDLAARYLNRRILGNLAPCMARLDPELHALMERTPWAPRRMDAVLMWPLQAPMIDEACHAMFREVRIESGRPEGSDLLRGIARPS